MSYSEDFAKGLQRLRSPKKEKFCDVVLVADGKKFPCHKVILAALSEFFENMFFNSFKV
jgi:hypothetical protein